MNYSRRMTEGNESIIFFLKLIYSNKIMISVFALIFASIFFVKAAYFTEDTYTASGVLYISNKSNDSEAEKINKNDIETSRTLTDTYIEILKTRDFLEEVSRTAAESKSWEEISEMVAIETLNSTELIEISVRADSAGSAYNIASALVGKAPEKLLEVYKSGDVEVVNPVYYPTGPNNKSVAGKTLMGLLIGFAAGLVFAYIMSMLDGKIRDPRELSNIYGISILGEVSNISVKNNKGKRKQIVNEAENILSEASDFAMVETYNSIRTKIMFSIPKTEEGKVVVVTSSVPGEGKTTTCINIAITFAQMGAKVIIIDCDLRRSRVHRYLELERGEGLSNVLCGFCELGETVQKGIRENLDVLSAGEIPLNPVELIESEEFGAVISKLKKRYDYIFIDTPPVTVVTDAVVAMQRSNGVVLITNEDVTTYDLVDAVLEDVRKANTKILGAIVLNSGEKHKKYSYNNYA